MLNFHQLTTFVTVISEGSMTAAADKLFLTQPAVSQQIRNLEEDEFDDYRWMKQGLSTRAEASLRKRVSLL